MYTVIDTIEYGAKWSKKEGLLAILDPDQVRAPFTNPGNVRIGRPDKSTIILEVTEVEVGLVVLSDFFFARLTRLKFREARSL